MTSSAQFQFRPVGTQSIEDRHSELIQQLSVVNALWEVSPLQSAPAPGKQSRACKLTPFLKDGFEGAIRYASRSLGRADDRAIEDDQLSISVDRDRFRYERFAGLVFEEIIRATQPYRAAVMPDVEYVASDHEKIVEESLKSGRDIDGRDSVFRFHPANYFDNLLCVRSFGIDAEDVAKQLEGEVERVSIICDGVLVIVTSDFIDRESLDDLHRHVASVLDLDDTL